ncbi:LysE family translocator [Pseudogulbenkiania ferrooxidans]|uniref:Lysine exporter protein (LYSE/YGGA) n=1 Tax=Pseudogulbenkiania ferrooxidans 2002 TaxID=279714 RepID=B9Z7B1_9NEIS|nr:LysE family translocator [Pseudogulbenkiania ferrooxidans]EEG07426.1 Lysine exporter protein (LYSE/YGGA) [Pseudogulbenkiania ferrooxidans 2002]
MTLTTWLLYSTVALATALSPGPAVLLAISNSLTLGARRALICSSGNVLGVFVVSGTAMAGLGLLLKSSATLFLLLKVCGALYLIYLGLRQWKSRANLFAQSTSAAVPAMQSPRQLFLRGTLVSITNPKSILFFTALFPQFMRPDQAVAEQFLVLTATFAACTVLSHLSYVLLARSLKGWFTTDGRARLFNRVCGGAFMLLGIGVFRLKNQAS